MIKEKGFNYTTWLVGVCLLFLSTKSFTQDSFTCDLENIKCAYEIEDYSTCQELADALVLRSESQEAWWWLVQATLWQGEAAYAFRKHQRFLVLADRALELANTHLQIDTVPDYFILLQNRGVVASSLGNFEEQQQYYRDAVAFCQQNFPDDREMLALAYFNIGNIHFRQFALDSTLHWLNKSLEYTTAEQMPDLRATLLLNLGKTYEYLYDYNTAITVQTEALMLADGTWEAVLGHSHLADYYTAIGQRPEAERNLAQARKLLEQHPDQITPQHRSVVALSACEQALAFGDTLAFQQAVDRLVEITSEASDDLKLEQMEAQNWQALAALQREDFDAVIEFAQRSLALGREQQHTSVMVESYQLIGQALLGKQQWKSALQAIQLGLQIVCQDFHPEHVFQTPGQSQVLSLEYTLQLLLLKMDIYLAWAKHYPSQSTSILNYAVDLQSQMTELLLVNRSRMRSERSRRVFSERVRPFFEHSMELFYQLYVSTGDEKWVNKAFNCSEKSRSLLLTETWSRRYTTTTAVPDSLLQREAELEQALEKQQLRFDQSLNSDDAQKRFALAQTLQTLEQDYQALLMLYKARYKDYYQKKFATSFVSIDTLRNDLLGAEEIMLSYTLADTVAYCVVVGHEDTRFVRLPLGAPLSFYLTPLYETLVYREPAYFDKAFELYQLLVAPALDGLSPKSLLLIPDDALWQVPFNALPTRDGGNDEEAQAYLVELYSLRWLYAAHGHWLLRNRQRWDGNAKYEVLAMAPFSESGYDDGSLELEQLSGSSEELDRVRCAMCGFKGKYLKGEAATRDNFLRYVNQAQIIHLSTHAITNYDHPGKGSIYFYGDESNSAALQADELPIFVTKPELLVLSACGSHVGILQEGEGIAGLAHFFSLSGCPNLLASQWKVSDAQLTTPTLMNYLYDGLAEGLPKNQAYSVAQRRYLASDETSALKHPYYWAPFLLVGDSASLSVQPKRCNNYLWWTLGGLLVLLLVVFIYRRQSF